MSASPAIAAISDSVDHLWAQLDALPSARRLSPEDADVIFSMAHDLVTQGRFAEALQRFSVLTFYRPTEARSLVGAAVCQQMLGSYDEAIHAYAFAARAEPRNPQHMLAIGECELLKQDYATARQTLELVIRFCQDKGDFEKTRLRAEGLLALATKGADPARS